MAEPKQLEKPIRPSPLAATIISQASITYLQRGDLRLMAGILAEGACQLTGAGATALFDIDQDNRPQLLACHPEDAPLADDSAWPEFDKSLLAGPGPLLSCSRLQAQSSDLFVIPLRTAGHPTAMFILADPPEEFDPAGQAEFCHFSTCVAQLLQGVRDQLAHLQTRDERRQAQKMEALGHLAAGIAHDFNNLLTIINGYTSLLIQEADLQGPTREHIDTILDAGERATDLSRQLLAFSRRQVLTPEPLLLNTQIEKSTLLLSRVIGEDIVIRHELAPDLPMTRADPGQLEQILMNLAINARDAMPEGGEILIRTGQRSFDADFLQQHKGSLPGDYTWVAVADSGAGMSPQVQARIFQPFFTTKRQGKGTGLGLATVYGIVKQSGGYICVDSAPNQGSCFTVYLPQTTGEPLRRKAGRPRSRRSLNHLTILIVEDDAKVLEFAARVLRLHGCTVLAAKDPGLAQELFQQHRDQVGLLLTDMVMPNLSGPLLARTLRRQSPGLPVLYCSGYGRVTFRQDFTCGEPGFFLAKPFAQEELLDAVEQCLDGALATPLPAAEELPG